MEKIDSSRDEMELLGFELDDYMDDTYLQLPMELYNIEDFDPAIGFSSNHDNQHISGHEISGDMSPGEVENEGDELSGTSTTPTNSPRKNKRKKGDRSRTLVSERKRRDHMKELLYDLRSMVPRITKMDKASIIEDAVVYIQELQSKAKKLRTEIGSLESSFSHSEECEVESNLSLPEMEVITQPPIVKRILQMDVIQVGKRGFHGRIVCQKGKGVAALLYIALETLEFIAFPSSNLATADDNFILTFTSNVEEFELDLSLPTLKLWIAQAFLNQGFEFVTLPSA